MKKTKLLVTVLLVLLVFLLGCGTTEEASMEGSSESQAEMTEESTEAEEPSAEPEAASLPPADGKTVLLIVGDPAAMNEDDMGIKARIESLGYTVVISDDEETHPLDDSGYNYVFITETPSSSNLESDYRLCKKPVCVCEIAIYDDMTMTGNEPDVFFGKTGYDQRQLDVVAGHPISGSLSGEVTIYSEDGRCGWGLPGKDAKIAAYISGSMTNAAVFSYDKGSPLADGTPAPGKRAGFFVWGNAFHLLTEDGLALFDGTVKWLTE